MSHLDFRTPVIRAVEAVKAVQRIPEDSAHSFFGMEDIWHYIPVWDERLCDRCLKHARNEYYVGRHLRAIMPYLEIANENRIDANIHPNCRCYLTRVTDPMEYVMATAIIWEYA